MDNYSFLYSIPYIIIYIVMFSLSLIELFLIKKDKKFIEIISFVILIFFFGFRGYVGSDFTTYILWFQQVEPLLNLSFNSLFRDIYEPGFVLLASIAKQLFDNYHFFTLCNTLVDFSILYLIIQRYCRGKGALVLFFYFLFLGEAEINLLRNIKAILLFIYSLKYVYEKSSLKYLVINLLGLSFHATALFFLPLYFLLRLGSRKSLLTIFLIGNIVYFLQIKYIMFLAKALGAFIGGVYQSRAEYYLESMDSSPGLTFSYVYLLVIFIILYKNFDKIIDRNSINIIFYNVFGLYCISYLFFNEVEVFKARFGVLFVFGVCLLLSEVITGYKKGLKRLVVFPFIFLLFLSKIVVTNSVSPTIYDNLLFGILPYEKRIENMNSFLGENRY